LKLIPPAIRRTSKLLPRVGNSQNVPNQKIMNAVMPIALRIFGIFRYDCPR